MIDIQRKAGMSSSSDVSSNSFGTYAILTRCPVLDAQGIVGAQAIPHIRSRRLDLHRTLRHPYVNLDSVQVSCTHLEDISFAHDPPLDFAILFFLR